MKIDYNPIKSEYLLFEKKRFLEQQGLGLGFPNLIHLQIPDIHIIFLFTFRGLLCIF